MATHYIGYSSYEFQKNKSFVLTDVQLVELDLLNHIYTRRGSRVMMPTFGTLIPDLVFEPLDETTLGIVENELTSVFLFEPRVRMLSLDVRPDYDNHTITATAILQYLELDVTQPFTLNIQFEA
jgi:phage baseplate assembly protein W